MEQKNTINLSKAVFKGKSNPKPDNLLVVISCFIVITALHETGVVSIKILNILIPVGIAVLYIVQAVEFFKFWLLDDRIVLKYSFRLRSKFKTILLSEVNRIQYLNRTWKGGPRSIVVIDLGKNARRKEYRIYFNDRKNKNVFVFLNLMYTRGFEIDISKCVRESLVEDQIVLGIQNDEKLIRVHY